MINIQRVFANFMSLRTKRRNPGTFKILWIASASCGRFAMTRRHWSILSMFFMTSALAAGPNENTLPRSNDLMTIEINSRPLAENFFEKIDLKKTSILLIANNQDKSSHKNFKHALAEFANASELYWVIAGARIQSAVPIDHDDTQNIAFLANKSAVFSSQFTLKNPADWTRILKAEQSNPLLLTALFSAAAITQIEKNAALSNNFAHIAPLIQWEVPPTQSTALFWQKLAKINRTQESNSLWAPLGTEKNPGLNEKLVLDTLSSAGSHIILLGGFPMAHFVPINQNSADLSVWRTVDGKIKSFKFERGSPQKFYLALGMNSVAYDILSTLIKRAKGLEQAGVYYSIENIDKNAFWWDIGQTTLIDGNELYLPGPSVTSTTPQTNILLFSPSHKTLNKWLTNINYSFKDMVHLHQLGIFDYSNQENISFYQMIVPIIRYSKNIQVTYNSMTEENAGSFLSQPFAVDQIDLGRKASRLLLKTDEKKSTCIELKTLPAEDETLSSLQY